MLAYTVFTRDRLSQGSSFSPAKAPPTKRNDGLWEREWFQVTGITKGAKARIEALTKNRL